MKNFTIKYSGTMTIPETDAESAMDAARWKLPHRAVIEVIAIQEPPMTAAEHNAYPHGRWGDGGKHAPK